ncbi:MAG: DNA methyltransferase [Methanosarcinales archaeon]
MDEIDFFNSKFIKLHGGYEFSENAIYCGDCKEVLKYFPKESVDLIYVDPPFFSNRKYEVIWNDGAELRAYEDRWKGNIMNYIEWLKERIKECYIVLKSTGSIYIHCDWHANSYIRVYIMDKIFGYKNFQNEIIWHYRRWTAASKKFQKMHDTILFYTKSDNYAFNIQFEPYSEKTIQRKVSVNGKTPLHKKEEGVAMNDVWIIPYLHSQSKERLGYPTQKPEALLERIIKASSNEGDLVLDPMCGCGTTIAVASKLNRKWIGIDVSPTACKIMATRRMHKVLNPNISAFNNIEEGKEGLEINAVKVYGYPLSLKELKKLPAFEFENIISELLAARQTKKVGDKGIDAYTPEDIPVQIKKSEKVGRNVVDNFETAIRREKKESGIIIAFSFTKDAYEEVARVKQEDNIEIQLVQINADETGIKLIYPLPLNKSKL